MGRRDFLGRTRTCGLARDAYGVLDRRSASPRKPRRQSSRSMPRGVLPGQGCRVVDLRGSVCRPQVRRARAVWCWTSGVARTSPGPYGEWSLPGRELSPGSPERTLVSPGASRRGARCGTSFRAGDDASGLPVAPGQLARRVNSVADATCPVSPGRRQPGRAQYGRERPPWQLPNRAAGSQPGGPSRASRAVGPYPPLPWRIHPGQWPPRYPQVGDTDRRLPSNTGRTRRRARNRADVRSGRHGPARGLVTRIRRLHLRRRAVRVQGSGKGC